MINLAQFIIFQLCIFMLASGYAKDPAGDFIKKLQMVGENGEIDERKAMIAEMLISKNENMAMGQVNKLIRKYRGTPIEAGLLFRKAELYVRKSKSARFFEFNKDNKKVISFVPKVKRSVSAKKNMKRAIDIYQSIERRFPNYDDLDLVMFNNAFLRQQLGQEKLPLKIYANIIKRFPQSSLIPDSHLALAEINYKANKYQDALFQYNKIKNYPNARVYPYALYKAGWAMYQLKDTEGAIAELENVVEVSIKIAQRGDGTGLALREEALNDIVLFYSEVRSADDAYKYFAKISGDKDVGEYILKLSKLYKRHGNHKGLELVLTDLIDNQPDLPEIPLAYKDLILNALNLNNNKRSLNHLLSFEKYCVKRSERKELKEILDQCDKNLRLMSYKLSKGWHKEWQASKYTNKDLQEQTEKAYWVYVNNSKDVQKTEKVRFSLAEFYFQGKEFRNAIKQYQLVSINIKDKKIQHDASYYAIVSLEKAVKDKWSDEDEEQYVSLATQYLKFNKKGKFATDVKFKRAFISYEKGRYNDALPGFKEIGWSQPHSKLGLKSQDLYLDILNLQKNYKELLSAAKSLQKITKNKDRKGHLSNLYRQSYFKFAQAFEEKNENQKAIAEYKKFAMENKSSKLADKAWWNMVQLQIKENKLLDAAKSSSKLFKMFPNSKYVLDSLKKSAELYEYLARTKQVGSVLSDLAKVDTKNRMKWKKLSLEFHILNSDYALAKNELLDIMRSANEKTIIELVSRYAHYGDKVGLTEPTLNRLLKNYPVYSIIAERTYKQAEEQFQAKQYSESFRTASRVLSLPRKDVPNTFLAKSRYIQAQILQGELERQSVKSKLSRLNMVLSLKTEKLDKAQRAYRAVIRYGDPEMSLRAFKGLVQCYQNYVQAIKNIRFTEKVAAQDEAAIRSELEKLIYPIEEKIVETLQDGMSYAKSALAFTGQGLEIRNDLFRMNLKLEKIATYKVADPEMVLPQ